MNAIGEIGQKSKEMMVIWEFYNIIYKEIEELGTERYAYGY